MGYSVGLLYHCQEPQSSITNSMDLCLLVGPGRLGPSFEFVGSWKSCFVGSACKGETTEQCSFHFGPGHILGSPGVFLSTLWSCLFWELHVISLILNQCLVCIRLEPWYINQNCSCYNPVTLVYRLILILIQPWGTAPVSGLILVLLKPWNPGIRLMLVLVSKKWADGYVYGWGKYQARTSTCLPRIWGNTSLTAPTYQVGNVMSGRVVWVSVPGIYSICLLPSNQKSALHPDALWIYRSLACIPADSLFPWQFEFALSGRGIRWQEASVVMLWTCYPKTLYKQFNREKEKLVITYGNRIQQNIPTKLLFKTRNHLTDCFHSWNTHEGQPFLFPDGPNPPHKKSVFLVFHVRFAQNVKIVCWKGGMIAKLWWRHYNTSTHSILLTCLIASHFAFASLESFFSYHEDLTVFFTFWKVYLAVFCTSDNDLSSNVPSHASCPSFLCLWQGKLRVNDRLEFLLLH